MYMLHCLRQQGSPREYMKPVAVSAAHGTGTAIRRVATSKACNIPTVFRRIDQSAWTENIPHSQRSELCHHVADRFDLRRDIHFHTCVTSAVFDEKIKRWRIETDRGDAVTAQFCITAVGCLSAANTPDFDGIGEFDGPIYHTGRWPHDGVDFNGLRVGVIGTGSSGIQSIPIIAKQAKSLTVFQRTPELRCTCLE